MCETPIRGLWLIVEPLLPPVKVPGLKKGWRPRISDQAIFYRLALFLRAGCAWEVFDLLLVGSAVSGRTVRRRLAQWRELGIFERVCQQLVEGAAAPSIGYLDATFLRSRGGGSEEIGLTRHGKGSKLQVIVNERSIPVAFLLVSANPAEATTTRELLELAGVRLPLTIVADRAYDSDDLRQEVSSRGSTLVVPHRRGRVKPPRDQELVATLYRERWRVERFNAWLAAWRRIATRWEKSLANYRSLLCLAISLIIVRAQQAEAPFCP